MKRAWLAVGIAAGCGGAPKAMPDVREDELTATEATRDSSEQMAAELRTMTMFAIGPVGFTGAMSEGEEATRRLAREPDAVTWFDGIAANGGPAPTLYAYWALRTLAPARAAAHDQALRDDHREVTILVGCTGSASTVSDIYARGFARPMPAPGTRGPDDPPPAKRGGNGPGM